MSDPFEGLKRPTILQIVPTLDIGGAERTTVDIARAIVAAGGRAIVASSGGNLVDELRGAGAEHVVMPARSKNPLVMAANIRRFQRLIEREHVDLVHARSRAPAWSALAAARLAGRPFVTTYHSRVHEGPALKVFYNSVMARSDAVIANSGYTARLIRKVHAPHEARLFTVPRGIDVARFDPSAVSRARRDALRSQWRIEGESRTIFILPARLTRWKGHEVAIAAAAALRAAGRDDFLILFVGDAQGRDSYAASLDAAISEKGLDRFVRLAGHCADMPAAYALADAVIAPSIEPEPFGRTAVEAEAMSRPVIVSDAGGQHETVLTPEAVGEGRATGFAVEPGDAGGLAAAMAKVLDLSPEARAAMGARGRAHAVEHFSLDEMARATLAIYAALIRGAASAR
ncbi:MAG: glycosyltransferase family 4 protein [Parvibaculum sp.]|uniref:glycosyltransferase family 4 protein n=1 Tax=Parvibaculum sp. TaxID=2024848 RepID=UPI00284003FB|nr:glycosyltransferase family 4 protein [Parvibaculum sp.]MDR3499792.1 glycosyltransferase family 4 protein [Parvibaculum sp.]